MTTKTLTDTELYEHTGVLKGKVVLITGAGNGIGQVGVCSAKISLYLD
jgi:FlaA1/EpsC-like NDP-sugar epimerase